MPVFVCRWPNGDFSAVGATSKEEAVELLAEVGNAESCEIFAINDFMVHFQLKSEADGFEEMLPVKFRDFGEQTHRVLCERIYPTYSAAISELDKDRPGMDDVVKEKLNAAWKLLKEALSTERKRQHVSESQDLRSRRD